MHPIYEWNDNLIGSRVTDGTRTGIVIEKCNRCASPCGFVSIKVDTTGAVMELMINTLSLLKPMKNAPLPLPG